MSPRALLILGVLLQFAVTCVGYHMANVAYETVALESIIVQRYSLDTGEGYWGLVKESIIFWTVILIVMSWVILSPQESISDECLDSDLL